MHLFRSVFYYQLKKQIMIIIRKYRNVRILMFLFLLSLSLSISGQVTKKNTYTGIVMDSLNNQPIEYVSVALYKVADNTLVTGTITNSKGVYIVDLLPDKYYIKSSFIGYKTKKVPVEITNTSGGNMKPIELNT